MVAAKKMHKNGNDKLRCNEMINIQVIQWRIGAIKSHYSLSLGMNTPNNTQEEEKIQMSCRCFLWMLFFFSTAK